ncbi:hypothetical protein NEUTE1DRAFT_102103 [Neurospora tetrasperma FGSC 2508]|uniref:Mid2 domain-containing protein n=1 Tax=Neurospora tetrasperma (strain FGSC 2508 / ATCC MYA-4615 / P0657) TaxID=510951 RepID=F8MR61_NEUT8|nr:uncharacterized protein NEUTE1DRAFT_102103 [Neurospora tetrasperma FGSC 2508]EGO56841.1 hypothetical protein NEUTE1DRAFT_102103 [Neurospora tetrasperma FGSC 2508]EGZ70269.1 hypothetical protein NEUTE2DRAFT_130272 [Neurospora tetrasperma FGSC 2509]
MASRARICDLQLGIRLAWVCLLGIFSSVAAQDSIPVVISAAPEAQTTLPTGDVKGTYIYSYGDAVPVSCVPGERFMYSSSYAACCASKAQCDFAVGCDGSVLLFNGKPHSTWFPSPLTSWMDWVCTSWYEAVPTIYQEVDPSAVASVSSAYYNRFSSDSQDQTTVEITQHITVTISSGIYTSIVTQPRPVSSSNISPETESNTGIVVSSSNKSENNLSTTTSNSTPTSSTTIDGNLIPETNARRASSRAWIAGVVAGPLLTLVAVGCLVFWLKRDRRRKTLAESGYSEPDVHAHDLPYIQSHFGQSTEPEKTSDAHPVCELEATEVHQGPFHGTGAAMRL